MAKSNFDYKLTLKNGKTLSKLGDLHKALKTMTDSVYEYHVNDNRNDFYNWVKDVFQDHKLAEDLLECSTKEAALFCLANSLGKPAQLSTDAQKTLELLKELPSLEFGNPLDTQKVTDSVKSGYRRTIVKNCTRQSKEYTCEDNKKTKNKVAKIKSKTFKEELNLNKQIETVKITHPKRMIEILKEVHQIE